MSVESSRAARNRKLRQDREAAVSEVLLRYPLMTPDRAAQLANDVGLRAILTQPPDWSPLIQRAKADVRAKNTELPADILDFVAVESVLVTAIFSAYFETFHEYPIA